MIYPEAIAHRAGLLAQENEMTHTPEEIKLVAKALWKSANSEPVSYSEFAPEWSEQAAALLDALAALRPSPALDALAMQWAAAEVVQRPFLPADIGGDLICDRYQGECSAAAIMTLPAPTPESALAEAQRLAPQIAGLAAERMKREAAETLHRHASGLNWHPMNVRDAVTAILTLPTGYTDAQLDAEAVARPKVRAMVERSANLAYDAVRRMRAAHVACNDLMTEANELLGEAKALKGAEHE